MARPVILSLTFLVSLICIPACQRQQALVPRSKPYDYASATEVQAEIKNASLYTLAIISKIGEQPYDSVATNSSLQVQPQPSTKPDVQLRKGFRQDTLIAPAHQLAPIETDLDTKVAQKPMYNSTKQQGISTLLAVGLAVVAVTSGTFKIPNLQDHIIPGLLSLIAGTIVFFIRKASGK
ncbi:hypothetical protein EXU85_24595 [Spirosoma sp. KCTC 42546]|uniref:hypothetical protein n=1 Tax=Spirosoma sp. KCTC 42546 TaxID=2520506 RepID=UPI001158DF07|nr:hypothetical protein [Spirosoma sp. KCTC 42546]QDK81617.1 hypothetical protein EXU85_24595 [Spirosoma sp. KCTC 42546]